MSGLTKDEWDVFYDLFEKKEGTNWYDTRELAKQAVMNYVKKMHPDKVAEVEKMVEGAQTITALLQIIAAGP